MGQARDRARKIIEAIPTEPITSKWHGALFQKYTGTSHATLEANWKAGGIMTCCNGFAGWYGREMGAKPYLGRFDLEKFLPTIGKGHTWIKSTADKRPKYGDILIHAKLHEDVALDFDGDILNRIAAGQGGKSAGTDILKRVRGTEPYSHTKLLGWIDIDFFFDEAVAPAEVEQPVPYWLPGWWVVTWRGQPFYYHFDGSHKVRWTQFKPVNLALAPAAANDTGSLAIDTAAGLTIRWGATGSVERLALLPSVGAQRLGGTWNGSERLDAVRLG